MVVVAYDGQASGHFPTTLYHVVARGSKGNPPSWMKKILELTFLISSYLLEYKNKHSFHPHITVA
jgi:hypothetical protein